MQTVEMEVDTSRERIVDLTGMLEHYCDGRGDGLVNVFVPHATAGLALMETGSGSEGDLVAALGHLLPRDGRYRHAHGSPVTGPTTCSRPSSARRSPCPCSTGGWRWAPGSPWSWSTSTWTIPGGTCG